ncbi:MAG: 4-oxalocrotonate tautomerase DmpI [Thermoplasmatota archaeon]
MPNITVEVPPIDVETKRRLVERLTEAAQEEYGIDEITVLIKENKAENVGVRRKLLADR